MYSTILLYSYNTFYNMQNTLNVKVAIIQLIDDDIDDNNNNKNAVPFLFHVLTCTTFP